MKERYEDIACNIVEFETTDVILESGGNDNSGEIGN